MSAPGAAELARRLAPHLWVLDTVHLGETHVIASYLIEGDEGLALVDVGPASTAATVLDGIRASGHRPEDVTRIVLTHVHLDHAGAAGTLLASMPRARVVVHPLGAPHLVDPTRLMASAARIYGHNMEMWWGSMTPVAADRIETPLDGARIRAGGRMFQAFYTPGHAVHHIAYYDEASQSLFPGDVAGVRIERAEYVRPPTPPPDLNLDDWTASVDRLRRLPVVRMYLPHFGIAEGVEAHWNELLSRLHTWGEFVLSRMRLGMTTDAIAAELAANEDRAIERSDPQLAEGLAMRSRYEHATNYHMTVLGYERYYGKIRPDLLR